VVEVLRDGAVGDDLMLSVMMVVVFQSKLR